MVARIYELRMNVLEKTRQLIDAAENVGAFQQLGGKIAFQEPEQQGDQNDHQQKPLDQSQNQAAQSIEGVKDGEPGPPDPARGR